MTRQNWPVWSAVAGFFTVGLACLIALWMLGPEQVLQARAVVPLHASESTFESAPAAVLAEQAARVLPQLGLAATWDEELSADDKYYNQLRHRIRWVPARLGNEVLFTPDLDSRLLLAKSAAGRAGLGTLGLSFKDVYGIISAETSWIPRTGASKDGTPNLGIAQFEPATARALGLRDPEDAVEAVHAAALLMKEAALWSTNRIAGLKLGPDERAEKLREGISIYYNLSTRGRNTWNGRNTVKLPRETQLHIHNARVGAQQAEFFDAQLQAMKLPRRDSSGIVTASSQQDGR